MAKNKKGKDVAEYPKLIKVAGSDKKVRVMDEKEEASIATKSKAKPSEPKPATWGN